MHAKTKNIAVTDVPLDVLKQAREYAVSDGVPPADLAVMRYALCQFVRYRDEAAGEQKPTSAVGDN